MRASASSTPTRADRLGRLREQTRATWDLARFAFDNLISPWPPFAVFLVVSAIVGGLAPLVQISATTGLIDALTARAGTGTNQRDAALLSVLEPYLSWLGLLVGVMIANWMVSNPTFQGYLAVQLAERVKQWFDPLLFGKALALQLEWFETPAYYDSLHRAHGVMSGLSVTYQLINLQILLARTLGCLAILGALAAVHLLLPLILFAGTVMVIRFRMQRERHFIQIHFKQTPAQRRQAYWRRLLVERAPAAEVRLFGLGSHIVKRWRALADEMLDEVASALRHNAWLGLPINVANGALNGVVILGLLYAGVTGRVTAGALVALLYAVQRYLGVASDISQQLTTVQRFAAELHYAVDFLALPREEARGGVAAPPLEPDGIRFEGVDFTYPNSDRPALRDVSLHIRPGQKIALVGENGAGKTTLAKLLVGLYRPTKGHLVVGGVALSAVDPRSWRGNVGVVFQDHARFALTVRENIGFGRLSKLEDRQAVAEAAHRSSIAELVEKLPDGYETRLGKEFPGGHDLSRGEWQKLAIARAHLRDAEVLILDEPASALDPLAELEVYRHFLELSAGKTVLLVSHRLGSARLADRIVFLHQGTVVEEGTHDELLARGGPYAELYEMQAAWYREEDRAKVGEAVEPEG